MPWYQLQTTDWEIFACVWIQKWYLKFGTDFRILYCVLSHISTLAHRNSSKLLKYVTLVPILLSGEFKENRIIHFWDNRPCSEKFTYFRIFSCILSHISTLAHRNSSKLSQYVTLVPILLSGEFKENRIINFWDNRPHSEKFSEFRIFSCVLSHISTLAHWNSSKLSQYITLTIWRV